VVMLLCIFEKMMRFGCFVNEVGENAILCFCAIYVTHGYLSTGKNLTATFPMPKKKNDEKEIIMDRC
jgi:hypothetical protein